MSHHEDWHDHNVMHWLSDKDNIAKLTVGCCCFWAIVLVVGGFIFALVAAASHSNWATGGLVIFVLGGILACFTGFGYFGYYWYTKKHNNHHDDDHRPKQYF